MTSASSFIKSLKEKGGMWKIGILALIGLVLIFFGAGAGADGGEGESGGDTLEERIAEFCSTLEGVGECRVIITYEETLDRYGRVESEKVSGIAVVCEGGGRVEVKERLTGVLTSLFDIGANRISIMKSG